MTSILLVDHSRTAGAGLATSLRKRPRLDIIGVVQDTIAAGESLARTQPDVILIDLHHRDGDGAALCAALRRLTNAPIVALASFMTSERWDGLKAAGATEFLLKHVDTAALERDLHRAATRHRHQAAGGGNLG